MSPERLIVDNLRLIEDLSRASARRYRLSPADAEELGSTVRLHLIENNYAVLRQFRGRCLRAYLAVVVTRQCLDYCCSRWGKWRPSAAARRMGATAVRFETLVCRDGASVDQAVHALRATGGPPLDSALLADKLSRRPRPRRRMVDVDAIVELPASSPSPEAAFILDQARRSLGVLDAELARLSPPDRHLMKLRFCDRLTVAQIARRQRLNQAVLYRHFDRLLRQLRRQLEKHGIGRDDVRDVPAQVNWEALASGPGLAALEAAP